VIAQGPSGSGKTTLLNTIGGRGKVDLTGDILINNHPFSKSMRRRIAYVLQEDIFFMHLTVREQLTFTAKLRLPGQMSEAEKKRVVSVWVRLRLLFTSANRLTMS
jgi:ABC-type multidrug transport system ATPase subunit